MLERFGFEKAYPAKTPMIRRSLHVGQNLYIPSEEGEKVLGAEYLYISLIRVPMYLANITRLDIAFPANLMEKYSAKPTQRHWKGINDIFCWGEGFVKGPQVTKSSILSLFQGWETFRLRVHTLGLQKIKQMTGKDPNKALSYLDYKETKEARRDVTTHFVSGRTIMPFNDLIDYVYRTYDIDVIYMKAYNIIAPINR